MKTKEKKEKSVIQELRDIREKISSEIQNLNFQQLKEYLEKQKTLRPKSEWNNKKDI